ncbi:MAG: nucleotide exchange factor GrpE [Oscillospiraceae bacterium]
MSEKEEKEELKPENEQEADEEEFSVDSTSEDVPEEAEEASDEETDEEKPDPKDEEIESLKKQLADEQEKYKRLDAEYYNYRNRSLKEKQDAAAEATSRTVSEILSVIDNFERALATETSDEAYKKGVEMIFNQFNDILKKLGVEEIEALNCPFDPNFHHAVNQVEDENFGENTVCNVFQKGYKLGSKVIRCAMVSVANP